MPTYDEKPERLKTKSVECLYAVDTDEVLLIMRFADRDPMEVLLSLDNAKLLRASLAKMTGPIEKDMSNVVLP